MIQMMMIGYVCVVGDVYHVDEVDGKRLCR